LGKVWIPVALAIVVAVGGLRAQNAEHEQYVSPWRTPWDYQGPRGSDHWSELDPEYAACNGKQQSPIDIRNPDKTDLPVLRFESKDGPLQYVINNGHTIRVNYHPGNGNFLLVEDKRYELTQFHFHRPSEERIHGKAYDMGAHLMYRTKDKEVAGVTVLVKAGSANSTIKKVWEHLPMTEGQEEGSGVEISPVGLLPRDTKSYYMYMGSLTAPPCTEGVIWFVLKDPIEMSTGQIDAFAKLYPDDARPVQPLNGRRLQE
jgi:carbonic anhydrase